MELYYNIIILLLVITNLYCFVKWMKADDLYTDQLMSGNIIESQISGLKTTVRWKDEEIQELRCKLQTIGLVNAALRGEISGIKKINLY